MSDDRFITIKIWRDTRRLIKETTYHTDESIAAHIDRLVKQEANRLDIKTKIDDAGE